MTVRDGMKRVTVTIDGVGDGADVTEVSDVLRTILADLDDTDCNQRTWRERHVTTHYSHALAVVLRVL